MASSKLTIIGFYNYMNHAEDDLFKFMTLPDVINREVLINSILLKCGEFEALYSDPYFMQSMIGMWSQKYRWTFDHWIEALKNVDNFNPLENYDRTEEWTNTMNGSANNSSNGTSKVTAYDSDELKVRDGYNTSDNGTSAAEGTSKGRAHGNIGVTSLSQLFTEYQMNTATWNIYEHITDLFMAEFIVPVY